MEEQEGSEIKIIIDVLKYTSNIVVDLTDKLTCQEEKISILENKLNKIQKMTMENNLKLKTIDYDKLNKLLRTLDKYNNNHNKLHNSDDSDNVSKYIIEKNISKNNMYNQNDLNDKNDLHNTEPKDKDKIDKLIGSIVKQKNILNQMINNDKINNDKINNKGCESGIDLTIKTTTVKSEIVNTNNHNVNGGSNDFEEDRIISAKNNDLNKANNILKQIRRRANIKKM